MFDFVLQISVIMGNFEEWNLTFQSTRYILRSMKLKQEGEEKA